MQDRKVSDERCDLNHDIGRIYYLNHDIGMITPWVSSNSYLDVRDNLSKVMLANTFYQSHDLNNIFYQCHDLNNIFYQCHDLNNIFYQCLNAW
jgi:hypothetical protein